MISFFTGIIRAEKPESKCSVESDRCKEACDQKHSTPKRDVWGNTRKESEITRWHREKCKNSCLAIKDICIERKRKLENTQKEQEELENQAQEAPENITEESAPEYPPSQPDSNIYKWTDENGVLHITNRADSIPADKQEQVEQSSDEKTEENNIDSD